MTNTALYILLLPIFALVGMIALGVLSLLFRSRWSAPEAEARPRSAPRITPRAAPGAANNLAQVQQNGEPEPA
ncbi:hypothetical protein [Roseomonas sp. WA12]